MTYSLYNNIRCKYEYNYVKTNDYYYQREIVIYKSYMCLCKITSNKEKYLKQITCI